MTKVTPKTYIVDKRNSLDAIGNLLALARDEGIQKTANVALMIREEKSGLVRDIYQIGSEGGAIFEYKAEPGSDKLRIIIYSQGNHESARAVIEEDILHTKLRKI